MSEPLVALAFDTGDKAELTGRVNVDDDVLLANVAYAIRQGFPQVRPTVPTNERVLLVGGGPSLLGTLEELRDLHFQGAKICALNGAATFLVEHNLRPSMQIIVDARPENSRFLEPAIPQCRYIIASQCAPSVWEALKDREHVWIWHACGQGDEKLKTLLDEYYLKCWTEISGGTTSAMRALVVLRTLGFVQFDLFGIDSCWSAKDGQHHAYAQPENDRDRHLPVRLSPEEDPHGGREFWVAPWHLKQFEDFLHVLKQGGQEFGLINIHGNGMLAYAMEALATADDLLISPIKE